MFKITYAKLLDKIYGGWFGKCLGGAVGAPFEGIKELISIKDFRKYLNPDIPNDDLDIQLLWLEVLENHGINISSGDLAEAWIEKCWYPFSEYGYFMKNYERGIEPPYSGIINNSFFKEGMGCAIRSEIWAMINPGDPETAIKYAYIDSTLDHADNAVFAEQFLASVESIAFFETNIENIITQAMHYIPFECRLSACLRDVLELYYSGTVWKQVRKKILNEYGHPDFTNIIQNMAFILIAVLYGQGNIYDTVQIALQCGYDTDCTCATSAAILGIINGYEQLDNETKGLIDNHFVCGIDVIRPSNNIKQLAEDTLKITLSVLNDHLNILEVPNDVEEPEKKKPNLNIVKPTAEGLKKAIGKIKPIVWRAYGPYYDQLHQSINQNYPSPHEQKSKLPDLVCMVNNEAFLETQYINEDILVMPTKDYIGDIITYEDLIPIENAIGMKGQMCIYLRTTVVSLKSKKIWLVVGNTDGFKIWVNKKEVLSADEYRIYTPYNNFCLVDFVQGNNEIIVKLLRRTDNLKFAIGFREYTGTHWHKSKWDINLSFA